MIIGVGHIQNEVNVLQKMLYWTSPSQDDPDIFRKAQSMQAISVAKVLAGELSEAWQFLQSSYFVSRLSADYDKILREDGKEALEHLKQYFSRDNIVAKIRNNLTKITTGDKDNGIHPHIFWKVERGRQEKRGQAKFKESLSYSIKTALGAATIIGRASGRVASK